MRVAIDTKSQLGVLKAEREVMILSANDSVAKEQIKSLIKRTISEEQVNTLAKGSKDVIWSGSKRVIGGSDKALSAETAWMQTADKLHVRAEVMDAHFSTDAPSDKPWEASSLELFIAPDGVGKLITHYTVTPAGADGRALVRGRQSEKVIAYWKRTETGYILDIKIPWALVYGYQEGWILMPVQAQINTLTPDGKQSAALVKTEDIWDSNIYARLVTQ